MSYCLRVMLILVLLTSQVTANALPKPVAKKGVLDLRGMTIDKNTIINLDGEWAFYWKKFIYPEGYTPGDLPAPDTYGNVPSYWTSYKKEGLNITGTGYATYRLLVLLPQRYRDPIMFDVPVFDASFELFFDNHFAGRNGTPGINRQTSIPAYQPFLASYLPESDTLTISVLVSNFQHRRGGFWKTMRMGNPERLMQMDKQYQVVRILSVGVLLSFFLFFFFFYLFFRKEKNFLFFALTLAGILLRLLCTNRYSIQLLMPVSWQWIVKAEYLGTYTALIFGMWYLYTLFPGKTIFQLTRLNTFISALFMLVILFFPVRIFSYTILYLEPVVAAFMLYYLMVSGKGALQGRWSDIIYFSGLIILMAAILNDILLANSENAFFDRYINYFGMQIFVMIQSVMLIHKWISIYRENEALTSSMQYVNKNLERIIEERAGEIRKSNIEIKKQNKKIASQNNTLHEALEVKNRVFHIIAHDLRRPIANLIQVTDMLKEGSLGSEDKQFRVIANDLAHSAGMLIENLLYWGSSQGNQINYQPDKCEIGDMVHTVIKVYHEIALQKNIALNYESEGSVFAYCDPELIMIVIRNLVSNALKFTPKSGSVTVMTRNHPEDQRLILITVTDTGIGISKEKIKTIFEGDKPESTPGTEREIGTGLGLKICRDLVKINHGSIAVSSIPGKGTTFSVTLPSNAGE